MTKVANYIRDVLAGKREDKFGISIRWWSAIAHSLFDSIHTAFLIKSRHGVDNLGNFWEDHTPNYRAYGRKDARERITTYSNWAVNTPDLPVRPTLPPTINKYWGHRWFGLHFHGQLSKETAGATTWNHFKSLGWPTLRGLTKDMKLPILVKTGILRDSLEPGTLSGGVYFPSHELQIFRYKPGELSIGTRFDYFDTLNKKRPIWPGKMRPWVDKALVAARDAMFEFLPNIIDKI